MLKFTVFAIVLLAAAVYSKKQLGCGAIGGGCGAVALGGLYVDGRTEVVAPAPLRAATATVTQVVPAPVAPIAAGCVAVRVRSRWTKWTPYGPCTKKCGRGVQYKRRRCIRGGPCSSPCIGKSVEKRGCGIRVVHSRWTGWTGFSSCSARCGFGTKTRSRSCHRGNICGKPCAALVGPSIQTIKCGKPIQLAYWTRWSKWGPCSRSCGVGEQVATRACVRNTCAPFSNCAGPERKVRTCGNVVAVAACRAAPVAVAAAPVAVAAAPVAVAAAPVAVAAAAPVAVAAAAPVAVAAAAPVAVAAGATAAYATGGAVVGGGAVIGGGCAGGCGGYYKKK